ncbi:MAG: NfeD family protein [Eubacteriales bacterium]|nr:NfeD family protein [Eubacteriales bacterium]
MIIGIPALCFWLLVLILCVVVEAITTNLVSLWFAVGALGALLAAGGGLSILGQAVVFAVLSLLLLLSLRPMTQRLLRPKQEFTNADRIVGQSAVVIQTIDNQAGTGQIRLLSQTWTARSLNNSIIPEGSSVVVDHISGVKAIVVCTQNEVGGIHV